MIPHLTITQLNECADGDLSEGERESCDQHLTDCLSCRQTVAQLQAVLDGLHRLPPESEPAPWVRSAVSVEVARYSTAVHVHQLARRAARQLAAAMIFIALGFVGGRWSGSAARGAPARRDGPRGGVAASVQDAGTAYVSSLAALVAARDTAQAGSLRQGSEAGLAALYAAAAEFTRLLPDDEDTRSIFRATATTRRRVLTQGFSAGTRF